MGEPTVYAMCDAKCKFPVYTQQQITTILQQLIETGSLAGIDPTLSPVVKLIQEQHKDKQLSLWLGTEAEYNALDPQPTANLVMLRTDANGKLYLCTDDSTLQGWYDKIMQDANAFLDDAKVQLEETAAGLIDEMEQIAGSVQITADIPMHFSVTEAGGLRITYDNGVIE